MEEVGGWVRECMVGRSFQPLRSSLSIYTKHAATHSNRFILLHPTTHPPTFLNCISTFIIPIKFPPARAARVEERAINSS